MDTFQELNNLLQLSAEKITKSSQSNFESSFFFLEKRKRKAIQAVYAFFRIVDDLVDEEKDPQKQALMIQFWKNKLNEIYSTDQEIPLLIEFKKTVDNFSIPQDYFLKLVEGCEMDISKKRYQSFDELYDYCYRVASIVGLVCMKIFEYKSETADQTAIDLGMAFQLTNIIRDVGVDLEKDRIYLPQEDLDRFNIHETEIINRENSEKFIKMMNFQYERAISYYQKGSQEFLKDKKNKLIAAKVMARVYRRLLEKIKNKNYPVLERKVKLNKFEKTLILIGTLIR